MRYQALLPWHITYQLSRKRLTSRRRSSVFCFFATSHRKHPAMGISVQTLWALVFRGV